MNRRLGFSLIEVILALGILSIALLIVFGIFTPFLNRTGEVIEATKVDRIADLITAEIQALEYNEVISILNQNVGLFANRSGDTLVLKTDPQLEQKLPEVDRFYAVSLSRNIDLSPVGKGRHGGICSLSDSY